MPTRKTRPPFRKVHAVAVVFILIYLFFANLIVVKFSTNDNHLVAFGVPMLYGGLTSVLFLYLFSHEDFFNFAKEIEKGQMKKEKKWLSRFSHFSKITTTFLMAMVGGPILGALTARLLLSRTGYGYALLLLANLPSTLLTVSVARGTLSFLF